jgi:hypothetical protein
MGLIVDAAFTQADGHAERIAALAMIEPRADRPGRFTSVPIKATMVRTSSMNFDP